jgi:hypothetical protein
VHSAVPSAESEVNLMLATRRYDVSHTCVIVTVLPVQTGSSSSGTRPGKVSLLAIEEAHLPPVRTILSLPYFHYIPIYPYSLNTRNLIYI